MAETMKAGRELDARIAEKLFGAKWERRVNLRADGDLELFAGGTIIASRLTTGELLNWALPRYSTEIDAAWQVVEKMFDMGWNTRVERRHVVYCDMWNAETVKERADTAPLAICLAALKACEQLRAAGASPKAVGAVGHQEEG